MTPSNSRPQTPNSLSKTASRSAKSPPSQASTNATLPAKKTTYSQTISARSHGWDSGEDEYAGEDDTETTAYQYNEGMDEDEFGLPSITSVRTSTRKRQMATGLGYSNGKGGQTLNGALYNLDPPPVAGRARANSSDIALERGPPSYPSAKKGDGKILRPQYKDILRGKSYLAARKTC